MKHNMKLNNEPFELIENGSKKIELRLYDEKRRKLKVNDLIEFTNISTEKKITVLIEALYLYPNFEELYKYFDKISLGYDKDALASYHDMEEYYSIEEQNKYGVVGIKIKKVD